MDERRTSLTDGNIDRAIGELLDVEPSADFVARVRARIDRGPVAPGWHWGRLVVAGAAIASLIVVALVGNAVWNADDNARTSTPSQSVAQAPSVPEAPPTPAPDTAAAIPAVTPAPAARVAASAVDNPLPQVIVSPAEAAGVRYFVSLLREGRVDAAALPSESGDVEEPMPIVIEPITVEPLLSAGDIQSGELQ